MNIIYISRRSNLLKRNIRFIGAVLSVIKNTNPDLVFVHYFRGSSLLMLLNRVKTKFHLDIRTGSVSIKPFNRSIYNSLLRFESKFFRSISIISEGLRNYLKISKKAYILPLGANPVSINRNCKHRLHLLYVGTLTNRRIEDTILGLVLFLKNKPDADIKYTIIGDGMNNEKEKLQNLINELNINTHVELKGYIPNNNLTEFYEQCNIGVSYIPITPYYQYQPATKTYEYLLSGMPVIATETYENKKVITNLNGLSIMDTPNSFSESISIFYITVNSFNEKEIKASVNNYKWQNIIEYLNVNIKIVINN